MWRQALVAARDMAGTSPREAVLTAWSTLEHLCREAATAAGVPLPQPANAGELRSALVAAGLPPDTAGVLARLGDLRNRAAHLRDITPVAARDFVDGCLTVAREVAALRDG